MGQTIRLPEISDGFPILMDEAGQGSLLVFSTPQARQADVVQMMLQKHGFQASVTAGSAGLGRPLYRVVVLGSGGRDDVVDIGKQVRKVFRENGRLVQVGG